MANPGHRARRQLPLRRPRHAREVEVRVLMARAASQPRDSLIVGPTSDRWIVQYALVTLQRRVSVGVAVLAPWMIHHATRL
jgi:hypothetical protein